MIIRKPQYKGKLPLNEITFVSLIIFSKTVLEGNFVFPKKKMGNRCVMKSHGFTLIEVLIVVAIVSILAVIAIPNFLQAQVRTKVSRSLADLRNINLALEIYRVDENDYPPNSHPDLGDGQARYGLLRYNMTTPVDYLQSTELLDPFMPYDQLAIQPDPPYYTYQNIHWYRGLYGEDYQPSVVDANWFLPDGVTRPEDFYGNWRSCSYGPDQKYVESQSFGQVSYDPTNGVVSEGNIWFSQKTGVVQSHR